MQRKTKTNSGYKSKRDKHTWLDDGKHMIMTNARQRDDTNRDCD